MKKTLLFILLLFGSFFINAQEIHKLREFVEIGINYHGDPIRFSDSDVENAVNDLLTLHLASAETNLQNNPLTSNEYLSKRILAHIYMYYYFDHKGDVDKRNDHLNDFQTYFQKLLDAQCISYNSQNNCPDINGGFYLKLTDPVSTRMTALALETFLEARKFFKIACHAQLPISDAEFEDRIQQATNIVLNDPTYNNKYFNGTATSFTTLSKHFEVYRDVASQNFLLTKGDELLNRLHPLRSSTNTSTTWQYHSTWTTTMYNWDEGQQPDGSWKDFGLDYSYDFVQANNMNGGREYDPFERWHDSELGYHSIMIEGLSYLYKSVSDSNLKTKAREQLIASINHLIDYNGETTGLENTTFLSDFVDLNGVSGYFNNCRITRSGLISKFHRETSDYPQTNTERYPLPPKKTVTGAILLRSLIAARNSLMSYLADDQVSVDRLNAIIRGIAFGITDNLGNNAFQQLYDLAIYLNRDAINGNFPGTQYTNDKLLVSFDNELISAFHQDDIPAGDALARVDNFYIREQENLKMVAGDFNNDTNDEAIISFEYGNIYRYTENEQGRLVTSELIYDDAVVTLALESGNFNSVSGDELIVALDNGEIRRYEEDTNGDLVLLETFYSNASKSVVAMEALDFNNDGQDELVVAFDDQSIMRFKVVNGTNLTAQLHGISSAPNFSITDLQSGDFNGDNSEELILVYNNSTNGLIQRYYDTSLGFIQNTTYNDTQGVQAVTVGDFDGNDEDELIVAFDDDIIRRYRINSFNNLTTSINDIVYSGSQLTEKMTVGNFNGDDKDELIIYFAPPSRLIYRCTLNSSGNLQLTQNIYNCGNSTNDMIVLKKSNTASRITTETTKPSINASLSNITVYPNPVNAVLYVRGLTGDTNFSIHGIDGKLITKGFINKEGHIDTSQLSKGFYILKIENQSFKILKN